jgi:hypothetical protein
MVSFRRHRRLGGLLVFVPIIAVAAPAVAWAQGAGTPVAEFEVIWDGLLSTSQVPADDSQWLWLRDRGVNTIVNLDGAMFDIGRYGFESFLWVAVPSATAPTPLKAERFLRFIQQPENHPAHISGRLRDSRATMVALLRYAVSGWSLESALVEGQRLNLGALLSPQQAQWLRGWAAAHPPGSHRRPRPGAMLGATPDVGQ